MNESKLRQMAQEGPCVWLVDNTPPAILDEPMFPAGESYGVQVLFISEDTARRMGVFPRRVFAMDPEHADLCGPYSDAMAAAIALRHCQRLVGR